MFTGIVVAMGRIVETRALSGGRQLVIEAPDLGLEDVTVGDSIAIQGVCHTVVEKGTTTFEVHTSQATLSVTAGLEQGRTVNLEKSLRLSDRLGGHLVSGHVDGVGHVVSCAEEGGSFRLNIDAPAGLARYIAQKGSICVDGVSLTVNDVDGPRFEVNVIPHTREVTTLGRLAAGQAVNLEVDMIARYVERMMAE